MITILAVVAVALLVGARRRRRRVRPDAVVTRTRRRAVLVVAAVLGLQIVTGTPAVAQDNSCAQAPNPERPGTGMVGAIDPPQGNGEKDSPYLVYGYAGMVWHVYDDNCVLAKTVTDPSTTIDTWLGNQFFNVGKLIVGATNSLHYTLLGGGVLSGLNEQIGKAAGAIFDNIYMQLFSVFMLLLAVLMFRQIWTGDLASVSKRALFALGGMWLAASTMVLVSNYSRIDDTIVRTTTGIQAGFVDPAEDRVVRHILPTELHTRVVYDNWLRGEFGKPDDPKAVEFGPKLLEAQAWTRDDLVSGKDADNNAENAKKQEYKQIATQLGPATGYFKGTDGSRTGAGLLALFQAIVYSLFQFFAKLAVLLAQLLLRILTLTAPVIGLVALIHHDILRRVGKAVGAVVLNVLVLSMLAGIHFKFLQLIFSPDAKLSMLTQMLLAGIVTLIFFLVGRPMKRMWQMVEMSVTATGASMPTGGPFSWFRRNRDTGPTAQDAFWETVRDGDVSDGEPGTGVATQGRRPRPEATHPVTATATRMDAGRRAELSGSQLTLGPSRPRIGPSGAELVPTGGRPPGRIDGGSMPLGVSGPTPSRVVDTVPVSDRGWDRGEDAMVVPSRVSTPEPAGAPRAADAEMVAGRPVYVVYRPSRGLEVRDSSQPRRLPLREGPTDHDRLVR